VSDKQHEIIMMSKGVPNSAWGPLILKRIHCLSDIQTELGIMVGGCFYFGLVLFLLNLTSLRQSRGGALSYPTRHKRISIKKLE
jgi:hypothetical protein